MFDVFLMPEAWAALLALVAMEIVLGIDNLIFVAIITNQLPAKHRTLTRGVGIGLALLLRLAFLWAIVWLVGLTAPVFDLGIAGEADRFGRPTFETAFSWRDIILLAGGIFLVWKATTEIHHNVDADAGGRLFRKDSGGMGIVAVIIQIIALDLVFSIDSILTAVGMTDHYPIMVVAVVIAVGVMFFAAGPVADFIRRNPTIVMLALAFLFMIGMVLIADAFGFHVPKGYIYSAMAFAVFVEMLNMMARRRKARAYPPTQGGV